MQDMCATRRRLRRKLAAVETTLENQLALIMASDKGFGGPASLFWDRRLVERNTLRWALGMKPRPFCAGDVMAGW